MPRPEQVVDLGDMQDLAAAPTSHLITVAVNADGTASFAVPRAEIGQGMTTAIAMMVAEELDLQLSQVSITLADARPELQFNQMTGGSNSMRSMYAPVRTAAAIARQQLIARIDAADIVTGRKQFTMDLQVPGALPVMVARPPTINGTVANVDNEAAVLAMPGVTDVAVLPHGVAIRAATFGQCIDAIQMIEVTWGGGTADGQSDASVEAALRASLPVLAPAPPLASSVTGSFFFAFGSNTPLEPDCAIASVTAAVHTEYQAAIAVLAEIDCTAATVNRTVASGVTGPRVTSVTVAVDPGFAVNPRGPEAQMIGGVQDGIAMALTSSLHIAGGLPLEGSWDNYFYTRQWNVPPNIQVIIMPATSDSPGGAGELAVAGHGQLGDEDVPIHSRSPFHGGRPPPARMPLLTVISA